MLKFRYREFNNSPPTASPKEIGQEIRVDLYLIAGYMDDETEDGGAESRIACRASATSQEAAAESLCVDEI